MYRLRAKRLVVIVPIAVVLLNGCSTWIFSDGFDSDVVGAAPSTSPPGDPADDALVYSGSVLVVNSAVVGSNAARIQRGTTPLATVMEMVTGGGAHTTGRYQIRWKAYAEAHDATLGITLLSSSARSGFRLGFKDGQFRFTSGSGAELIGSAIAANTPHSFDITVDMDAKTATVALDGMALPPRPLLDASFESLKLLRFDYAGATVEAVPGRYVIDFASIRKR